GSRCQPEPGFAAPDLAAPDLVAGSASGLAVGSECSDPAAESGSAAAAVPGRWSDPADPSAVGSVGPADSAEPDLWSGSAAPDAGCAAGPSLACPGRRAAVAPGLAGPSAPGQPDQSSARASVALGYAATDPSSARSGPAAPFARAGQAAPAQSSASPGPARVAGIALACSLHVALGRRGLARGLLLRSRVRSARRPGHRIGRMICRPYPEPTRWRRLPTTQLC